MAHNVLLCDVKSVSNNYAMNGKAGSFYLQQNISVTSRSSLPYNAYTPLNNHIIRR
jgi:hypothetical protein